MKRQLDLGIQQILDTHVQVSNGNFTARAPLSQDNVLWRIAYSLNNLLVRLQRLSRAEYELQRARAETERIAEAIHRIRTGQAPLPLTRTGTHLDPPTIEDRVSVIRQHLARSVQWKGPIAGITEMRRHYTNYLKGLPNIKEYRLKLVTLKTEEEINEVLNEVVRVYSGFKFERRKVNMEGMAYSCAV